MMAQDATVRKGHGQFLAMAAIGTLLAGGAPVALLPAAVVAQQSHPEDKPDHYQGFYLGGNLGYALPQEMDLTTRFIDSTARPKTEIDFDSGGVSAAVRAGYEYRFLRGEVELHTQVLVGDDVPIDNPNTAGLEPQIEIDGTQVLSSFFTNAFIETPFDLAVKPYIGGGIGVGVLATDDDTDTALAINGQAGMTWDVAPRIALDANYRYTHFGEMSSSENHDTRTSFRNYDGHAFEVGLRYRFGSMAPKPAVRPVRPVTTRSAGPSRHRFPTREDLRRRGGSPAEAMAPAGGGFQPTGERPSAFTVGNSIPADPAAPQRLDGSGKPRMTPGRMTSGRMAPGRDVAATAPAHPVGRHYAVQLASFSDPENARRGWDRFNVRHGDLLAESQPAVVPIDVPGKGTFHRLYAIGLDKPRADRLCSSLRQRGADCQIGAF